MLFAASRSWVAKVALWRTILSTKSLNCSSSATKHALGQAFCICIFSKWKANVVCSFSVKFGGRLSMDCSGTAFLYIYILIALNQISQSLTLIIFDAYSSFCLFTDTGTPVTPTTHFSPISSSQQNSSPNRLWSPPYSSQWKSFWQIKSFDFK